MTIPKAGYKGNVSYGDDSPKIGSGNWTYSGETRNMQDIDQFTDEVVAQLPLQIVGGDITITGNYLVDSDAGQKKLKVDFDAATPIVNLRLYTDKDNGVYMTPSAGGLNGGQSHVIVTNVNNVGDDKSGVGTFSATLHVNGTLEQEGATDIIRITTLGDYGAEGGTAPGANDGTMTLWGELVYRPALPAEIIECYFQWGLTVAGVVDNDSYTDATDFASPLKDTYEHDETLITALKEKTTYYYRAAAKDNNGLFFYGEIKSVYIPAA